MEPGVYHPSIGSLGHALMGFHVNNNTFCKSKFGEEANSLGLTQILRTLLLGVYACPGLWFISLGANNFYGYPSHEQKANDLPIRKMGHTAGIRCVCMVFRVPCH